MQNITIIQTVLSTLKFCPPSLKIIVIFYIKSLPNIRLKLTELGQIKGSLHRDHIGQKKKLQGFWLTKIS